jgi:hypothetical protein
MTISGIENPTKPGSYGPFGVITRNDRNGSAIDYNSVFGFIGIAEP